MGFNIADLFERAVDAVPDRVAVVCGDHKLTYRAFDEEANRLAHHLLGQGFGLGDHIGIYAQNSLEWIVAMMATFKIRAVPININFRYVEDELAYLFDNADLVAVLHDREYAERIAAVKDATPGLTHFVAMDAPVGSGTDADLAAIGSIPWSDALAGQPTDRPQLERSGDDQYVLYTGGTTGMPKGVVWRHEDVFYALGGGVDAYTNERVTDGHQLAEKAATNPNPIVALNPAPLMHGAAQWGTLRFLFEGGTAVLVHKFSPAAVWSAVEDNKVNTITITGDAMARPLVEALEDEPDRWDLSSLFVVSSSAVVFSPALKEQLLDLLPNIIIVDAIGSSEGGMNGMVIQTKGQTVNQDAGGPTVKAGRDAAVLDEDLRPMAPGTGQVGKLARAGNIPIGYYKDPVKTASTFLTGADGVRYVVGGDLARLEEDGSITLLGRGSACINSGGEKIFPEEVESVLKTHASVYDVLVVGVPDPRWGSAVCAVVQARPGATAPTLAELADYGRAHLAGYKLPRHLVVCDEVVRSPSGKPDYPWATQLAKDAVAGT